MGEQLCGSPQLHVLYHIPGGCGASSDHARFRQALNPACQSLTLALVIVTAALNLVILTHREHVSFRAALSSAPGSAVVFSLGIVVIWPLLALMGYHVRVCRPMAACALSLLTMGSLQLLLFNITTIEQVRWSVLLDFILFMRCDLQVRNKFHATLVPGPAPPNPFALGRWYRNVAYLLCRPAGYTWIEASAVKMLDKREINPGAYMDLDDEEYATQKPPLSS